MIPPDTDAAPPPMIIIKEYRKFVAVLVWECSITENPAVLTLMEWKKETEIFSNTFRSSIVFGLLNSSIKKNIAPRKMKNKLPIKTIFEFNDIKENLLNWSISIETQ